MNKPINIPTDNDALMAELKHDFERDRWLQLWKRYQNLIIGVIALIILATAAHSWWRHMQVQRNMEMTDALYAAMGPQNADSTPDSVAANLLAFAEQHAGSNAGFMARIQAAAILLQADKKTDALLQLEGALKDEGADDDLKALVTVKYVQLGFDRLDGAQVDELLTPLAGDSNPYRFNAWELLALNAYRAGNQQAVRDNLEKMQKDADTPAILRVRAADLQRVLVK